jgi:hypothetical protein
MLIPLWFAISYPIAIIFFILILYFCSKKYPKKKHYSILSRSISGLGNEKYESSKLFKEDFFFIPLANVFLISFLSLFLHKNNFSVISIYFLLIGEAATLITSFATEDFKNKVKFIAHLIFSSIAFASTIIGFILLGFSLKSMSILVIPFSFLPLLLGIFAGISVFYNLKYVPDVKKPILKNINFWEWLMFFSIIFLFIFIYFILLLA